MRKGVEAKERLLKEDQELALAKLQEKEHESELQMKRLNNELLVMQKAYDEVQSNLFDLKAKHDSELDGKQNEIELLIRENERLNDRVLNLEREQDKLRGSLEQAREHKDDQQHVQVIEEQQDSTDIANRLAEKTAELEQLKDEVCHMPLVVYCSPLQ